MPDPYAVDAQFYDLIHGSGGDDIGLWLSFAGRTDRPVLEVGTGTGRIALELARAGHAVVGVDPSGPMLTIARGRAEDDALDVQFIEGAVGDLALEPGHYGFVLVPADVFLYCADGEAQLAMLRALRTCLTYNGTLAIDLPGPALWLDSTTNGQALLVHSIEEEDGTLLDVWQLHEDDLGMQTRTLRVAYERTAPDGSVRRWLSAHQLRYPYRFEMEYLLALGGLALQGVYGDYDLGELTNDSERMIAIATRRDE